MRWAASHASRTIGAWMKANPPTWCGIFGTTMNT